MDSIASSAGDSSSIKIEPVEATKADSTVVSCIANANGASICRGEMLNLNKLTCYLDLITRKVVRDDGSSAMERAIIKSRLKIPFWSADEVRFLTFILKMDFRIFRFSDGFVYLRFPSYLDCASYGPQLLRTL